jgi:hypothetical protein
MLGNYQAAAQLVASQVELSSTELVSYDVGTFYFSIRFMNVMVNQSLCLTNYTVFHEGAFKES